MLKSNNSDYSKKMGRHTRVSREVLLKHRFKVSGGDLPLFKLNNFLILCQTLILIPSELPM